MYEIYYIKSGHHLNNGFDQNAEVSLDKEVFNKSTCEYYHKYENEASTTDDMSDIDELMAEEYGDE